MVGGGRKSVNLPWLGGPEWGPETVYVAHIFAFLDGIMICRLYILTLSDQAEVTLRLRVTFHFRGLVSRLLAGPPLFGGPKKFYHQGPKPLLAALTTTVNPLCGSLLHGARWSRLLLLRVVTSVSTFRSLL